MQYPAQRWHAGSPADDPYGKHLNSVQKYVASRTMRDASWANTTILSGDVAEAVARLKAQDGGDISVLGSGNLVRTLMEHDLVDVYALAVYPIVLGSGKRFFPDADATRRLRLVDSKPTSTGGVLLTYVPIRG